MTTLELAITIPIAIAARTAITRWIVGRMDDRTPGWGRSAAATLCCYGAAWIVGAGIAMLDSSLTSSQIFAGAAEVVLSFAVSCVIVAAFFRLTPGIAIATAFLIDLVAVGVTLAMAVGVFLAHTFPWAAGGAAALALVVLWARRVYLRRTRMMVELARQ